MRNYVDKGHEIQNQPLSKLQNDSLDCFDKISRDGFSTKYLIIFNCPLWDASIKRGETIFYFIVAPALTKISTTSECPIWDAT